MVFSRSARTGIVSFGAFRLLDGAIMAQFIELRHSRGALAEKMTRTHLVLRTGSARVYVFANGIA